MNKSAFWRFFAMVAMCLVLLSGCADIRNLQIERCRITSVTPKGLAAVEASLSVDLYNPGQKMTLTDTRAYVREKGRDIILLTSDPVTIEGKSSGKYDFNCTVSLQNGLSVFDLKNLISTRDFSTYYVDIALNISSGNGKARPVKMNGIPLEKLIGK